MWDQGNCMPRNTNLSHDKDFRDLTLDPNDNLFDTPVLCIWCESAH